jgi:hypothetical protein
MRFDVTDVCLCVVCTSTDHQLLLLSRSCITQSHVLSFTAPQIMPLKFIGNQEIIWQQDQSTFLFLAAVIRLNSSRSIGHMD